MRCVLITPLLFLATVLLALVTCQQSGRSTCPCLKTSKTVLRRENIRSYTVQKAGVCHIAAIVFKKVRGFTCSNPQLPWVKRAMQYLDEKAAAIKTTARPIFSTSTFKTTSTLITTSHWNGQDEPRTSPVLIEFNKKSGRLTCPCLKTSKTVLRKENIRSYTIQKAGVCHIDAIVFKTVRGSTCSNPQLPWVKRAMQYLDEKLAAIKMSARPIFSTSTFKTTSTLNTTSHWNGQDEPTTSPELFENINEETSQRSLNCCLKTGSNRVSKNRVVDYRVQTAGVCPINAIVLWIKKGKAKCYEPDSEWIKEIMRMVDQKRMSSPSQNGRKRKGRKQKKTI
ncbi:hypothetical protein R3I93_021865 [Phoxinus phoxinus]|uniref:Chemokine interleukin-8-like domain-containing protein n=1 Tax=Phoxinus phoxinus TaxID=58324 RepID=A0AAN9C635_9TELE